MKVYFDKSFHKALTKVADKSVLERTREIILTVESVNDLHQISNIKKLVGFKNFYRIRLGDYRIGVELKNGDLWFITIAHRKDIYSQFP